MATHEVNQIASVVRAGPWQTVCQLTTGAFHLMKTLQSDPGCSNSPLEASRCANHCSSIGAVMMNNVACLLLQSDVLLKSSSKTGFEPRDYRETPAACNGTRKLTRPSPRTPQHITHWQPGIIRDTVGSFRAQIPKKLIHTTGQA